MLSQDLSILLLSHLNEIKELNSPQLYKYINENIVQISFVHFVGMLRHKTFHTFISKHTAYEPRCTPNWISKELALELVYNGAYSLEEFRQSLYEIEYSWGGNTNWGRKNKVVDLFRASEIDFSQIKKEVHGVFGEQKKENERKVRTTEAIKIVKKLNLLGFYKSRDIVNILNTCKVYTPTRLGKWDESNFSRFLTRHNIKLKTQKELRGSFTIKKHIPISPELTCLKKILGIFKLLDPDTVFPPKVIEPLLKKELKIKESYSFQAYLRKYCPAAFVNFRIICGTGKSITAQIKFPEVREAIISYLEKEINDLNKQLEAAESELAQVEEELKI